MYSTIVNIHDINILLTHPEFPFLGTLDIGLLWGDSEIANHMENRQNDILMIAKEVSRYIR